MRDEAAKKLAAKAREVGIPIPEDAQVHIETAQKCEYMVCFVLKWFDEELFEVCETVGWVFSNGEATFGYPIQPEKMHLLS